MGAQERSEDGEIGQDSDGAEDGIGGADEDEVTDFDHRIIAHSVNEKFIEKTESIRIQ